MLTLEQAQLFRMLVSIFGEDRVIPQMSVFAVCGGEAEFFSRNGQTDLMPWAKGNKCLFTVVNSEDDPCFVVELFEGLDIHIDPVEEAHRRILPELLSKVGVRYAVIDYSELSEVIDPGSELTLVSLLGHRIGIEEL